MNETLKWVIIAFLFLSGFGVIGLIGYFIIKTIQANNTQQAIYNQELVAAQSQQYNPANTAINAGADVLEAFL